MYSIHAATYIIYMANNHSPALIYRNSSNQLAAYPYTHRLMLQYSAKLFFHAGAHVQLQTQHTMYSYTLMQYENTCKLYKYKLRSTESYILR